MTTLITAPLAELTIAANVRTDTRVDQPFVTNIKQHGVLVPIHVTAREDGGWDVVDGQRRTLAAQQAGLTEIPALVVDAHTSEKDRLIDQIVVNDQRAELTTAERAKGYQQLSLFGLGVEQIARRTNAPKAHVAAAVTVAENAAALAVIEQEPSIDLTHAASISEFTDLAGDVEFLTEKALEDPRRFDHYVQQIRDRREADTFRDTLVEQLAAAGIDEIEPPSWDSKDVASVRSLYRTNTNGGRTSVDEKFALEHAGDDLRAYVQRSYGDTPYAIAYAVVMPGSHGWTKTYEEKKTLTDDEKAARKAKRETKQAWDTATTVRRTFLKDIGRTRATTEQLLALAAGYIVGANVNGISTRYDELVHDLLDIVQEKTEWGGKRSALPTFLHDHPNMASRIVWATTVASIESYAGDTKTFIPWASDRLISYFELLVSWGYTLSDVEQSVLKGKK